MVFENIIQSAVTKFGGDYIENLDVSQFSVWSGNALLKDLQIRTSALDDLDLPVKLKFGYVEKVDLKIPFKTLWKDKTVANVTGVYLLVVPNQGVKYNAEKEEKDAQASKQKTLQSLEEARANRRRKDEKTDETADPGFVEKMVGNIIRNLEVNIEQVHVRFEDEYTNRKMPFAAGITLNRLALQTTNENWIPEIMVEAGKLIHKLVDLDSLAIYWNPSAKLISNSTDNAVIKEALVKGIGLKDKPTNDYSYILKPMSITSHLKLNLKPEFDGTDFQTPKADVGVQIDSFDIVLGKYQYQNLLEFLEALERFTLSNKYLKYRPNFKEYKGHYKTWWHFAYDCVLNENVKRRRDNWSWERMKRHRKLVRKYQESWVQKLTKSSVSKEALETIKAAEQTLDVFNLNVARQQAELDVDRRRLTRVEDQPKGWFSGWFGGGGGGGGKDAGADSKIAVELTPEEREQLFAAIDYQENQPPTTYPKRFVEYRLSFRLTTFGVTVQDNLGKGNNLDVLKLNLDSVGTLVEYRTSASGLKLDASIQSMIIHGLQSPKSSKDKAPVMVQVATAKKTTPLIKFLLLTKPLDESCDVYVHMRGQPLNVIYHAPTVNKLVQVFKPPESVQLKQISAAAMAKYENVKTRSTTGLSYMVENRSKLVLDINLQPALIMIPETGIYTKHSHLLLVDLGTLVIKTTDSETVDGLVPPQCRDNQLDPKLKSVMDKAYDNFQIELDHIQILFSGPKDDWMSARKQPSSLHLLQPTGFRIILRKSGVDDKQIPKLQVIGNLPDIVLDLSEVRLLDLLKLALSIPTPPPDPVVVELEEEKIVEPDVKARAKMKAIMETDETDLADSESTEQSVTATDDALQINLKLAIVLEKVAVNISRTKNGQPSPYLNLGLSGLNAKVEMRAFDMAATVDFKSLAVEHMEYKALTGDGNLFLIRNPLFDTSTTTTSLLSIKFIQADKKGPHFATQFKSVEQFLKVSFEGLDVGLHQEALTNIQEFGLKLQKEMETLQKEAAPTPSNLHRTGSRISLSSMKSVAGSIKGKMERDKRRLIAAEMIDDRIVKTKIRASLERVKVEIGSTKSLVGEVAVQGLLAGVQIKEKTMEVTAAIKHLSVRDPIEGTKYPNIVGVRGKEEMLRVAFTQFNRTEEEKKFMTKDDVDMSIEFKLAALRFVFLQAWVNRILGWLTPFQEAAAEAASATSVAMTESAKATAEKVKENIPKLRLDVDLDAPIIIIPTTSKSTEVLYANMGRLTLANYFVETKAKDKETGKPKTACLESIKINLTEMKLSRVLIDPVSDSVQAEVQLLEPVSFVLNVNRNLCFGWYKDQPEVEIKGHFPIVKMSMSEEDYGMIIRTSTQNLSEGEGAPPPKVAERVEKDREAGGEELEAEGTTVAVVERHDAATVPTKLVNRILFDFTFDGLWAGLYMGSSNLREGVALRAEEHALGQLHVKDLVVNGTMKENGFLGVTIYMVSFTIDDTRSGQKGITRLMDKKGKDNNNLIDVVFSMDGSGNQKADVKLRPFYLCFAPDFIGSLANFFVVKPSEIETEEEEPLSEDSILVDESASGTFARPTTLKTASPTSKPVSAPSKPTSTMSVYFAMEDPEIILVEDATKPDETQALFLKLKVEAKYEVNEDGESIRAAVKGLELFSTYYATHKRTQQLQVLNSLDIGLISKTDEERQKVDVRLSDVVLKVSPPVIHLLSAVAEGMAPTPVVREESDRKKQIRMVARQNLWKPKKILDDEFWFISTVQPADGVEAVEAVFELDVPPPITKPQDLFLHMDSVCVHMEVGSVGKTVPLIFLESSLSAELHDWSFQMQAKASLKLQIAYYNEMYDCWEPLIETVETVGGDHSPWELTLAIEQLSDLDVPVTTPEEEVPLPLPPKMSISLIATEVLQITVTKSCLEMLGKLTEHFQKAVNQMAPPTVRSLPGTSPYVVCNETGIPLDVMDSESLQIMDEEAHQKTLAHGEIAALSPPESATAIQDKSILRNISNTQAMLNVNFPNMTTTREVDVARAELRSFSLPLQSAMGKHWTLVSEVSTDYGRKLVTLRSPVKVVNNMEVAAEVYYLQDTNLEFCGRAEANGGKLNVPMPAAYSAAGELYFKPISDEYDGVSSPRYDVSSEGISWNTFVNKYTTKTLQCGAVSSAEFTYNIQACGELDEAYLENTTRKTMVGHCWTIHLRPLVTFHNILPYPIQLKPENLPNPVVLKGGESSALPSVSPGSFLQIKISALQTWKATVKINEKPEELSAVTFQSDDAEMTDGAGKGKQATVHYCPTSAASVHLWEESNLNQRKSVGDRCRSCGHSVADLFRRCCEAEGKFKPKGGSSSSCCASQVDSEGSDEMGVIEHPASLTEPFMFTFNGKDFFKSKKVSIKVGDGEWSDGVPVDAVGTVSRISSKIKGEQPNEISVGIALAASTITKLVTIAPFYLLKNNAKQAVEIREVDPAMEPAWTVVPSQACVGFWPKSKDPQRLICVRYQGSVEESLPFSYVENYEMFVRIPNVHVGLNVSCHIADGSVVLNMEEFEDGMAPALLINHTRFPVVYKQAKDQQANELRPNTKRLFSWNNHIGRRELLWSLGNTKDVADGLYKDGYKEQKASKDAFFFWVSFLSGRQRCLLFTEDVAVAMNAHQAYEFERIDTQITLSLQGVGLSLVNNVMGLDLMYISMASSGIIWEKERRKQKYKPLQLKDCKALETAFDKYNLEKLHKGKGHSPVQIGKLLVDFESEPMRDVKSTPARAIRRCFQPGVWAQHRTSPHLDQMHVKINHLQIDNMLPASIFQTVLAPVPPPKSVASESIPKPFAELSFIRKHMERSNIQQVKIFQILVQEMALKVELNFINSTIALFTNEQEVTTYNPELLKADLTEVKKDLSSLAITASSGEVKTFYDNLHFGPMKIQLSFSLSGQGQSNSDEKKGVQIQSEVVNLVLKSVGVTLTDIQGIVFKMAFFERKHVFMTQQQLVGEITDHYVKQVLKQVYVLVLGLDIIGNPFGLLRDLSTGVEDLFYEPIQGAIQGPEEFAEGLALGVKSLFGHAVGGAAGAVGRITGTLGKGIAALTLDDEYQRKRQEALNRRPANAREGLAEGGKGLVMGVFDGVTGVFVKPWEGAREEGAVGFAKGLGKGLIGAVTRPTAGIVDFASSSFGAVKQVSDVTQEVKRLRPPRFIGPDRIIRPYSTPDSEGNMLLQETDKGKYNETDHYVAHAYLNKEKKFYIFITDKRVMVISKNDVFGHWEVDWQYPWTDLGCEPTLTDKGLRIELKERRKKWLIGRSSTGKLVTFMDRAVAQIRSTDLEKANPTVAYSPRLTRDFRFHG